MSLPWVGGRLFPFAARYATTRLEIWIPPGWPAADGKEIAQPRWRRSGPGARVSEGRGLDALDGADEVVAWIPAAQCLLLRTRLPTRSPAKIAQALPYALEEQLIEPPEQSHFVFAQDADGALSVAVAARERMQSWLAGLAAAGLSPTRLTPVTLSLPFTEGAWTLAVIDGELVMRRGLHAGLGGPCEPLPPVWLHAALAETRSENRAPERLVFVDVPAELDLAAWSSALGLPLHVSPPAQSDGAAASLNLLQQTFAPRGRAAGLWRAYSPAAALLTAALAVSLVSDAIEWTRLSRAARAGEQEMRALLMKSFPDTRVILDAALQMRRGLERLGAGTGAAAPDDMLALLAPALPLIERESRARLQGFEYGGRSLELRLVAASAETEAIARGLRMHGLDVDVQLAAGESRLRVRAAKALP